MCVGGGHGGRGGGGAAAAERSNLPLRRDGKNTSLQQLGYEWVGQDDGWQQCKQPPPACTAPRGGLQKCGPHKGTGGWHAEDGTPQLDMVKYPSLKAAVARAHSHGLKADWCELRKPASVAQLEPTC